MTKRKAAKSTDSDVEPMVIALAEQLGSFLGRAQKKADAWMDNEALREQITQIRDGAADLLKQVNKSAASVRNSVGSRALNGLFSSVEMLDRVLEQCDLLVVFSVGRIESTMHLIA